MFAALPEAFSLFFVPQTLLVLAIALVVGMATSILPGIGTVATLALLLSFTFGMEPHLGIMFLVVLLGAGGFSGALTAILINVPGETQNAATLLDGYPMSQQGRAGEAIGAAAVASALGAVIGVIALIAAIPVLRQVILAFGPAEMFAMTLAGIALISVISRGNTAKGLISGMFGMTVGFIGLIYFLGGHRYTFGFVEIYDGLPLIPVIIGLFAVPEVYELLRQNRSISQTGMLVRGGLLRGAMAVLRRPAGLVRGGLIGVGVGIVPGVGSSVAPWVSYFVEKARSKDPDSFGQGNINGVIAPEAANDAKDGGGFMPLLAFGVPGSLSMAILIGAFQYHGLQTGHRLFDQNMSLIWLMIMALLFANFGSSILGLSFANILVKITIVPAIILAPIVLSIGLIGAFADHRRLFSIFLAVAIGFLGIGMMRADYPRPPMLVGFVLTPMVERYFHLALRLERGEYTFLLRPITLTILLGVAVAILYPLIKAAVLKAWRHYKVQSGRAEADEPRVREGAGSRDVVGRGGRMDLPDGESRGPRTGDASGSGRGIRSAEAGHGQEPAVELFSPLASVVVSAVILGIAVLLITTSGDLRDDARLFPMIVLPPMALLAAVVLAREAHRFVQKLRAGQPTRAPAGRFPDWWVTGWVVLFPALIVLIGMVPASGLYVALARLFYDRTPFSTNKLIMATILGVSAAVGIQVVFQTSLGVRLLGGILL